MARLVSGGVPSGAKRNHISADTISKCFEQAIQGRKLEIPGEDDCLLIAEWANDRAPLIGTMLKESTLGIAEKHMRLVLRHLPGSRSTVYRLYSGWSEHHPGIDPTRNPHFAALVEFDLVMKSATALLDRFKDDERKYTWHDLANELAAWAMHAWRQNGRKGGPLLDVKADAPICAFVTSVLAKVGHAKSEETVSDALRYRAGPRSRETRRGKSVPNSPL